jgi:hypothetical protein
MQFQIGTAVTLTLLAAIFLPVSCKSYGKFWDVSVNTDGSAPATLVVFAIADTGQTLCSSGASGDEAMVTCPQTVVGQDGDFSDKPNARSFTGPTAHATYTSDYTTTDNVTTLVWKTCMEGKSDATCGTGSPASVDWTTAGSQCTALNTANSGAGYAGKTNWRLPTAWELETLPNLGTYSPAIDVTPFPGTDSSYFWSSEVTVYEAGKVWLIGFDEGDATEGWKTDTYGIRCVSGAALGAAVYTDMGNGTVRDERTRLVWQKCPNGLTGSSCGTGAATTLNWASAIGYCQGLNLAGLTWRLPSRNELASILDRSTTNPTINSAAFPATGSVTYWSSTTHVYDTTEAWTVNFDTGWVSFNGGGKSSPLHVRCVTGP